MDYKAYPEFLSLFTSASYKVRKTWVFEDNVGKKEHLESSFVSMNISNLFSNTCIILVL